MQDILGQELAIGDIVVGTKESSVYIHHYNKQPGIIVQFGNKGKARISRITDEFVLDEKPESSPLYNVDMLVKITDQAKIHYGEKSNKVIDEAIALGLDKPLESKLQTKYIILYIQLTKDTGIGKKIIVTGKSVAELKHAAHQYTTDFYSEYGHLQDIEYKRNYGYTHFLEEVDYGRGVEHIGSHYVPHFFSKKAVDKICKYDAGIVFDTVGDKYNHIAIV